MRKPQDPRHHGLKEPQKTNSKTESVYFSDLNKTGKITLQILVNAWNKISKDLEGQGRRVVEGPWLEVQDFYGARNRFVYTYEWDNLNYQVEIAEYNVAIAAYDEQLAKFQEYEEKTKKTPPGLDEKIARTERRLANLKAHRDGQPIPYPEG